MVGRESRRIGGSMIVGLMSVSLGLVGCGPIDNGNGPGGGLSSQIPSPDDCAGFETLEGEITEEMTISSGQCFDVVGDLKVEAEGHLIIEPGTVLRFKENTGLSVWGKGKMTAVGEADAGILMTGVEQTPGYWKGVGFHGTNSTDNKLANVTIEAAGGGEHYRAGSANLAVDTRPGPVRLSVKNTTLRNGAGVGFWAGGDNTNDNINLTAFENNTLTGNAEGAARVRANAAGKLSATSSYTGNDNDLVLVESGKPLHTTQTWQNLGVPYRVKSSFEVEQEATLTIEAGATLVFAENQGLSVWGKARMKAIGTADAPITFTGVEQIPGYWKGIAYHGTNGTDNQLDHVIIEYGGGNNHYRVESANLAVDSRTGPVRLSVKNTTLRESAAVGFWAGGDNDNENVNVTAFENNTLTKNAEGAAWLRPNVMGAISDTSTYAGNGKDFVYLGGKPLTQDQKVDALDVPYRATSGLKVENGAAIEIAAGAEFIFEQDSGLAVWNDASLKAVGADGNPVVFTGAEQTNGYWKGIAYHGTNSTDNVLDQVVIEYGGGKSHYRVESANLAVDNRPGSVQVTVKNAKIRHSGAAGIHIERNNEDSGLEVKSCEGVVFEDVAADMSINPDSLTPSCPWP